MHVRWSPKPGHCRIVEEPNRKSDSLLNRIQKVDSSGECTHSNTSILNTYLGQLYRFREAQCVRKWTAEACHRTCATFLATLAKKTVQFMPAVSSKLSMQPFIFRTIRNQLSMGLEDLYVLLWHPQIGLNHSSAATIKRLALPIPSANNVFES